MIKELYSKYLERVKAVKKVIGKPFSLAEKISESQSLEMIMQFLHLNKREEDYVDFALDSIASQNATSKIPLLQFR